MTLKTILTVGALMLTTALAGCGQGDSSGKGSAPSSFKSVDITGAPYANTLALPDVDGKMRDLSEFKGKVVFVFFGYTQCPDVCPTTMAEIAEIKKKLGPDGAKVQGVFVTVDPERDTAEVVKAYVASFGPDMIGLRAADDAQLKAAALHFKGGFNKKKRAHAHKLLGQPHGRVVCV
jgi:protein SCO1